MSRDEARALARKFAGYLRHHREFRGGAYVGAAPLPTRPGVDTTWPSGQINSPPQDIATDPRSAPTEHAPAPAATVGRSTMSPPASPMRDPVVPADRASATWPSRQVASPPVRSEPAVTRAAEPARLPLVPAAAEPAAADSPVRTQASQWSAAEKLDYLRHKNIGNCQRCKLSTTRTQIVFGVGDPRAQLMFIGEAPGFDEDRQGEPFVGAAGKRLTLWLGRLGMTREQVFIANVLKCRPPGNRDPEPEEVERCSPFLRAQIRAIAPKVIVCLGRYAGILLLGKPPDTTLREMRTRGWTYVDPGGAHVASLHVTYHPSYVIRREKELPPGQRNPADDTVMSDLQQAIRKLSAVVVGPQNS